MSTTESQDASTRRVASRPHRPRPTARDRARPRPATPSSRAAAARVVATTVTFVVLAALLNARGIARTAETQPPTAGGDAARAVGSFLQSVSGRAFLDRPRRAIDSVLHPEARSAPAVQAASLTPPRTGTVDDPLRVLLVGDSLMENVAEGVRREVAGTRTVRLEVDAIPGTAINWPFRFDWPNELRAKVRAHKPEVVGVMFGGHDWRRRKVEGGAILAPPDPAWREDYERRVEELVRIASSGGARVYWLGIPDVEPGEFQRAVPEMNAVFRSMGSRHPGFTYVDTRAALAGPDGGFATYLRGKDGRLVLARQPDGVHFEPYGQDILAELLVGAMGRDWPDLAP